MHSCTADPPITVGVEIFSFGGEAPLSTKLWMRDYVGAGRTLWACAVVQVVVFVCVSSVFHARVHRHNRPF